IRPILLFCLLAMVLLVAHGEITTCRVIMPENLSVDIQFVKCSVLGLQTQIQQLMSDNVKLRQSVDNVNS
ncbi:hypothetical protein LSAT2_000273, partial [Lamellibrachia satsuma]